VEVVVKSFELWMEMEEFTICKMLTLNSRKWVGVRFILSNY